MSLTLFFKKYKRYKDVKKTFAIAFIFIIRCTTATISYVYNISFTWKIILTTITKLKIVHKGVYIMKLQIWSLNVMFYKINDHIIDDITLNVLIL